MGPPHVFPVRAPSLGSRKGIWRCNMMPNVWVGYASYPLDDDRSHVAYPRFNRRLYFMVYFFPFDTGRNLRRFCTLASEFSSSRGSLSEKIEKVSCPNWEIAPHYIDMKDTWLYKLIFLRKFIKNLEAYQARVSTEKYDVSNVYTLRGVQAVRGSDTG